MSKICFVSNSAWSIYNFRMDVIRHFIDKGHEVLVLAEDDEYSALLRQNGCRFEALHFNNRTINPLNDYLLFRKLQQLYRKHSPDFIFHYVIKPNIYGSLAATTCNIPSIAVITGLGYAFSKSNWLYYLTKAFYRRALQKALEIWFLNNEDAKFFLEQRIVPVEKLRVLHGEGINVAHFSPLPNMLKDERNVFKFLMSTRLLKSKGVAIYADAARILKKKNYAVSFDLIGFYEKHHPDSIHEEDIERWQNEGLISYKGFASDVRTHLANADCFVFPSFYNEGVPRCLMEAASMGLPVITSRNRGCKEVVEDGITGYLCNMKNPFDLADKMEKVISISGDERTQMGQMGRRLVHHKFDMQRIIQIYEQAVAAALP